MITDIKNFVKDYKKEILIGVGLVLLYNIGWQRGFGAAQKVIENVIRTAEEVM